jgi:Fe-S-cluster-containing dehydrogenase component
MEWDKWDRRTFLKVTGISLLGFGAKPVFGALAGMEGGKVLPDPQALRGKRWAMVIDLRKECPEGCRDCSEACNHAHNIPDFGNPKDEIKWIWNETYNDTFPGQENRFLEAEVQERPVIVLCNHCDNPPCVRVCPTKATWKREEDGIVMMDWHRCIGCRYCMAACPYGSRSFNWTDPRLNLAHENPDFPTRTKGVVEKCNFCEERLTKGQLPACVEACPQNAMTFGDLGNADSQVRRLLQSFYAIRRKPELGTKPEVFYIV